MFLKLVLHALPNTHGICSLLRGCGWAVCWTCPWCVTQRMSSSVVGSEFLLSGTSASSFALNLKPLTTTGTIGAVTSTAAITTTTPRWIFCYSCLLTRARGSVSAGNWWRVGDTGLSTLCFDCWPDVLYCPTFPLSAPPVMTYAQLESLINKWSLELEDQEKHFLHQATQVNAWDRTLIENGEKVRWQPAWFC